MIQVSGLVVGDAFVVLFSTNLSMELFEFANGFKVTPQQLKQMLIKSVDAIFDESIKDEIRERINAFRV